MMGIIWGLYGDYINYIPQKYPNKKGLSIAVVSPLHPACLLPAHASDVPGEGHLRWRLSIAIVVLFVS